MTDLIGFIGLFVSNCDSKGFNSKEIRVKNGLTVLDRNCQQRSPLTHVTFESWRLNCWHGSVLAASHYVFFSSTGTCLPSLLHKTPSEWVSSSLFRSLLLPESLSLVDPVVPAGGYIHKLMEYTVQWPSTVTYLQFWNICTCLSVTLYFHSTSSPELFDCFDSVQLLCRWRRSEKCWILDFIIGQIDPQLAVIICTIDFYLYF